MSLRVVIPARMASTRLPGKPLREIAGKPMLRYLVERLKPLFNEGKIESLVIATDSETILQAAPTWGVEGCLTDASHASGTARIAETVIQRGYPDEDIIVNVQCDEPLLPTVLIQQVGEALGAHEHAVMATLSEPLTHLTQLMDPNIVKVVTDQAGYALYFSRAPIPWYREGFSQPSQRLPANFAYQRHIGLYSYRVKFLKRYLALSPSPLESIEALEQLRVLYHGERIGVVNALEKPGPGIDTEEDLNVLQKWLTAEQEGSQNVY